MKKQKRTGLIAAAAVMFAAQGALSQGFLLPLWQRNYGTAQQTVTSGLAPDQLLFALAGFRELVAQLMWVRADSFFDTGNYDAVLPIIR